MNSDYVFLTDCVDISEAEVIKSFLISQGFNPRIRDEQMRGVAPHLGQVLGKLVLEIPEKEFVAASLILEKHQTPPASLVEEKAPVDTQAIAKKSLFNAILGCILVPVICNFYSMILGYRVLRMEVPLSKISRNRLMLAIVFNSVAFYTWLRFGFLYFQRGH